MIITRPKAFRFPPATQRLLWAWAAVCLGGYVCELTIRLSTIAPLNDSFLWTSLLNLVWARLPTILGFFLATKVSERQRQRHLLVDVAVMGLWLLLSALFLAYGVSPSSMNWVGRELWSILAPWLPYVPWLVLLHTGWLLFGRWRSGGEQSLPEEYLKSKPTMWLWWTYVGLLAVIVFVATSLSQEHFAEVVFVVYCIARGILIVPTLVSFLFARRVSHTWARMILLADALLNALPFCFLLDEFLSSPARLPWEGIFGLAFTAYALLAGSGICVGLAKGVGSVAEGTGAAVRSVALHPALQERGYFWITKSQCMQLWSLAGESAFHLPPWSDVGVLPGVTEGNIEQLAKVARAISERRDRSRS